ncbi:hypothetical protein K458DRAFT_382053 [Lentithecium fluviatile CBS 122367]|uniref:Uncharacterized protein n=1 Tax=Lentithecium fluviatile CBS 122367 TaxID=1168545 RepID=A0A6G1JPY1_9PLEO|nr:hypothetical protein K458DRAFT_382053 [Lentithecium fluviatile CBS 122367]
MEILNIEIEPFQSEERYERGFTAEEFFGWRKQLNSDLVHLANAIKQSRKLRTICFKATIGTFLQMNAIALWGWNTFFPSTLHTFLSVENMTSLELDLSGTDLLPNPTRGLIQSIVTSICSAVLEPLNHTKKLRLCEMIVNLSITHDSPNEPSATHDARCFSGGTLQLKAETEEKVQLLALQMAAPTMVRILTHQSPTKETIELRAFDALTCKTSKMVKDLAWDADDEVIVEDSEVSDAESEIPDLDW